MGHRSMRRDDGGGNGGWWLAHHSHARPSSSEVAAGPWLRGRNHCRANHSSRELLRHSTLNYTRNFHVDHGRRRGKTFLWSPLDSGGTNCLGMGFHAACHRPNRLRARTRNRSASLTPLTQGKSERIEQFSGSQGSQSIVALTRNKRRNK